MAKFFGMYKSIQSIKNIISDTNFKEFIIQVSSDEVDRNNYVIYTHAVFKDGSSYPTVGWQDYPTKFHPKTGRFHFANVPFSKRQVLKVIGTVTTGDVYLLPKPFGSNYIGFVATLEPEVYTPRRRKDTEVDLKPSPPALPPSFVLRKKTSKKKK
jgi:hypothetical protein